MLSPPLPAPRSSPQENQLVQESVAGLVVAAAAPPVVVMPVNDGMEKYVVAQAAGEAVVMDASLVNVTTSGLFDCPLPATVKADVKVCDEPLVVVEKFQMTSLGVVLRQPGLVVVRALVEYPVAYVVLLGSWSAVTVTGNGFGLLMETVTSPLPPG
jgi:hypothetical protein